MDLQIAILYILMDHLSFINDFGDIVVILSKVLHYNCRVTIIFDVSLNAAFNAGSEILPYLIVLREDGLAEKIACCGGMISSSIVCDGGSSFLGKAFLTSCC